MSNKIVGPQNGLKVIDFSTYLAGPKAAKILADLGADVIKVDSTGEIAGGDFGKMYGVPNGNDEAPMTQNTRANKRCIRVNMKTPEGHAIMEKLLETTDIFITNFREGALKKLGMDYETLSAKYPRLVFGSVTGYGDHGVDSEKPGFDSTAYWARGGLMGSIGEPDAPPPVPLAGFGDNPTGAFLALGVLAAIIGRERTGKGQKVTGALYNTAIFNMSLELACANYHPMPKKSVKKPASPLINVYQCKDGKWISLTSLNYRKDWVNLCNAFERPDLIEDERCNTPRAIAINCKEVTAMFAEIVLQQDRDVWVDRWTKADIPFELVQTQEDILADEQAKVNNFLVPCNFPNGHTIYLTGAPVQLSSMGATSYNNLVAAGMHTEEVVAELGYSAEEIAELMAKGVLEGVHD